MNSSWEIIYYEKADGSVPVEDFINTLTVKQAAKTKWEIDMLEQFGTALTMPYVRKISGEKYKGLSELRIQFASDISRIFYFLPIGKQIVLLHGFVKKSQKTPSGELDMALKNMNDYLRRNEQ
ncbi:MAG: type II toxin-antitoxin system RelE/ParE family toxin [Oscillospiraceae bacterium]|jgi:phage-related protein|nr:type II toxin-antitoxin system RelE/ParE family toxin [Oscillospiraceae bacterium]